MSWNAQVGVPDVYYPSPDVWKIGLGSGWVDYGAQIEAEVADNKQSDDDQEDLFDKPTILWNIR